jgi:hypothetical protein
VPNIWRRAAGVLVTMIAAWSFPLQHGRFAGSTHVAAEMIKARGDAMKPTTMAQDDDVVVMYRKAIEEELRLIRDGLDRSKEVLCNGASIEEKLQCLAERHTRLEHEVALLRTIVLRLVSKPVDCDHCERR